MILGLYRSLRAVLYIIDRELDLSLLGDQRVLKEGDTAQEDGVAGALKTETHRQTVGGEIRPAQATRPKAGVQWRTSMISV